MSGFVILEADGAGSHPAAGTARPGAEGRGQAFAPQRDVLSGAALKELALAAEAAGIHALSFADGPLPEDAPAQGRLDAIQRAAFLGPVTHSLALLPRVDTVYTEPFHIATQLASLDYVSAGRAGWLVHAETAEAAARAVGREPVSARRRLEESAASVEVNRRLWDAWEDDAVIRDVATGRYVDANKIHYADFETQFEDGSGYSVKGPSIIPRPPQGQLPVFAPSELVSQAGPLLPGAVDAVLVSAPSWELLTEEISALRDQYGTGGPALVAELDVVLDARGQQGQARLDALEARTAWNSERARFVGTAQELIQALEQLLAQADGVRLHLAELDVDLPELARLVLVQLRESGIISAPQRGADFRQLLGRGRPENRFATAALSIGKD